MDRTQPLSANTRYSIKTTSVRIGDILLTRSGGIVGLAIRVTTSGEFTHAMVCSNPSVMIEAVGTGVRKISLRSCYVADRSKVKFLRPKPEFLGDSDFDRFAEIANRRFGASYSYRGAAGSVAPFLRNQKDLGIFCSQLVARCYADARIDLFGGLGAEKVTPALIEKCPNLNDVTAEMLKPLDSGRPAPAEYIDGNLRQNAPQAYQKALTAVHKSVISQILNLIPEIAEPRSDAQPDTLHGLVILLALLKFEAIDRGNRSALDRINTVDKLVSSAIIDAKLTGKALAVTGSQRRQTAEAARGIQEAPSSFRSSIADIRAQLKSTECTYASRFEAARRWAIFLDTAKLSSIELLDEIDWLFLGAYEQVSEELRHAESILSAPE